MPRKDNVRLVPREAEETKAQKFRRLANQRMRALKADMKRIRTLTGPGYEGTIEQLAHLASLIEEEAKFTADHLRRGAIAIAQEDDIFAT